jgi:hypothetical protein
MTTESNIDLDVCGYVTAERKANSPLEDIYSEQIANSQEAIRLAKKIDPTIQAKIEIINYIENDTLVAVKVRDMATGFTGVSNMKSKEMFKLFHHPSAEKSGFSEYGIGGKLKNMLLANRITYNTKTNTGPIEQSIWDIKKSIEQNSISSAITYDCIEKCNSDFYKYISGQQYFTGTELSCEDITEPYRTADVAESILDVSYSDNDEEDDDTETKQTDESGIATDGIYKRLCKKYIRMDTDYPIHFIVYKNNELVADKQIESKSDLGGNIEKAVLHIYQSNATKKYKVIYEKDTKWYESEPCKGRDVFRKDPCVLKSDKIASVHANYTFISNIIVYCSTAEHNVNKKMGYDTWRKVEGGYIVKTNSEKLRLKWSKWNSHRTRYAAFRGAIEYTRDSDVFLNSDKAKTTSDDRPFHELIRWNILHLTDKYFSKMKTENGFYDTEITKKRPSKTLLVPSAETQKLVSNENIQKPETTITFTIEESSIADTTNTIRNEVIETNTITIEDSSSEGSGSSTILPRAVLVDPSPTPLMQSVPDNNSNDNDNDTTSLSHKEDPPVIVKNNCVEHTSFISDGILHADESIGSSLIIQTTPVVSLEEIPIKETIVKPHIRTILNKKDTIEMMTKLVDFYSISNVETILEAFVDILCIMHEKGGDKSLFHTFHKLAQKNILLISQIIIDFYNRKYSDNEDVVGGKIIKELYSSFMINAIIETEECL